MDKDELDNMSSSSSNQDEIRNTALPPSDQGEANNKTSPISNPQIAPVEDDRASARGTHRASRRTVIAMIVSALGVLGDRSRGVQLAEKRHIDDRECSRFNRFLMHATGRRADRGSILPGCQY